MNRTPLALVGLALIGCHRAPDTLGGKAPALGAYGGPATLAEFVVGKWQQSLDTTTARTDVGKRSAIVADHVVERLEMRADGAATATVVTFGVMDEEEGRWRIEGSRVLLDFPRPVPADAPLKPNDDPAGRRESFEGLVATFGPLELDADLQRLRRCDVNAREDGSTFMGVPVWERMAKP